MTSLYPFGGGGGEPFERVWKLLIFDGFIIIILSSAGVLICGIIIKKQICSLLAISLLVCKLHGLPHDQTVMMVTIEFKSECRL